MGWRGGSKGVVGYQMHGVTLHNRAMQSEASEDERWQMGEEGEGFGEGRGGGSRGICTRQVQMLVQVQWRPGGGQNLRKARSLRGQQGKRRWVCGWIGVGECDAPHHTVAAGAVCAAPAAPALPEQPAQPAQPVGQENRNSVVGQVQARARCQAVRLVARLWPACAAWLAGHCQPLP